MTCLGLIIFLYCTPPAPPAAIPSNYCQITKYIYWSPNDTRMTKEQVDEHNRIRKKVCK